LTRGRLFVVSAPSGAGKTTLTRHLLQNTPDLVYSISHTTRAPRANEQDGVDYFFVSTDQFREMIDAGAFLEWAEVFGRHYGTTRKWVENQMAAGVDVLCDVDIDGARQILEQMPQAVSIFIVPPSLDELTQRLQARSTEDPDQLAVRLGRVREEVEAGGLYDYLVINDTIDRAVADLEAIVRSDRLRGDRHANFWTGFFNPA
jgi:guanylate kinase